MRDKLIELICEEFQSDSCIAHCNYPPCYGVKFIADHLIANGVTFVDDTNVGCKSMTNGDRIRSMTDEELAWELMQFRFDAFGKAKGDESVLPDSQPKIVKWLKQPVEGANDTD